MKKTIEEIEALESFEDLDILERLQVIKKLYNNTLVLIDSNMIDTEEDKETIKDLYKINKIFNKIIKGG